MKKLLLSIVIITFAIKGFGQDTTEKKDEIKQNKIRTYVIEYDFQTGLFPNGKKIKPKVNEPIVFKIKNINRLAYTVKVTAKDSTIALSDIPKQFEIYKQEKVETAKKELEAVKPTNKTEIKTVEASDLIGKKSEQELNLINKNLNLSAHQINQDKLSTESSANSLQLEKIPGLSTHFTAQKELTDLYINIRKQYNKLNTLLDDYLFVTATINDPLLTELSYNAKYKDRIAGIKESIESNRSVYNDFNTLVSDFQSAYKSLILNPELSKTFNYGGTIKLTSLAENQEEEVKELKAVVEKIKFRDIRYNLEQATRLFENPLLFEYTSSPIQPIQDLAIFNIDIVKKDKENSLFYDERKFSRSVFTKHGIRLDASLGLAGSFFSKSSVYALQFNNGDEQQVAELNKFQFNPSFVGFFTTSYRSSSHFSGGLSLGLGFNVDEGKLILDNFYIGPSLIVGKYERITLTAGGTFKNIPRLNNAFNVGDIVPNSYTLDNITTESYRFGYFFGVSYNITRGVKDQLKFLK